MHLRSHSAKTKCDRLTVGGVSISPVPGLQREMIEQFIDPNYVQICEAVWAESSTIEPPVIQKACRKLSFCDLDLDLQ